MANRLADSTSPYLLQHKDNPVDWHEWGPEAFVEARERDVPILLSVGYSACHWCHVMAHESFEDEETAAEMNRLFVNVKVDREERPDVDSVYMDAVQAMTGRGGWPMTVWLTPDGKPFYAGTYFPDKDRHGMPGFRRVIAGIGEAWDDRRQELVDQSARLTEAISRSIPPGDSLPGLDTVEAAYTAIESTFDAVNGGFGGAPKFPQQPVLEFILRVRAFPFATRADEMLATTLTEMANGGIHDHLGGGFARYSVDEHWLVPHFEKMLYDNAQLARIYLWAGVELGDERLVEVARSTLDYIATDLGDPQGGMYSAEDADSDGGEGLFYTWSMSELVDVLGPDDAEVAATFFGASEGGNFEGLNILHRPTPRLWDDRIESIRRRLLDRRASRNRPGLDDKVVSAWNGLAIRAFAEAGASLGDERYVDAATATARFVTEEMDADGSLARSWRRGRISGPGFLDDHSSMAVGLFSLYAATGDTRWFEHAIDLVQRMDPFANEDGGYSTVPADRDELPKRPTDPADNPLPSGNALAAEAHLMTWLYTGDAAHLERADAALRSSALLIDRYPSMVGHHLSVLTSMLRGTLELAIVGPGWRELAGAYWTAFRPHVALAGSTESSTAVPLLEGREGTAEGALGYVCRGFVCDLPTSDSVELTALLA
jgi:uncharacterized protein YyaL (SSP411 family)